MHLNKLPATHPIMLNQIIVSDASGIFSVASLVRFLAFYIMSHCIFLLHHSRFMAQHAQALQSNVNLRTKKPCCLQLLVFLQAKESPTIAPFWYLRPQVFPKCCCHYEFNASRKEMPIQVVSVRYRPYRQRYIYERKIVTLFPRNILHENTALLAENFRFPLLAQLVKEINKVIFV